LNPLSDVRIARQGCLCHITLDRPKAINALTLPMLRAMQAALDAARKDDSVLAVAVDGAGERGLCAGGDIRAIYASLQAGDGMAETFWREEYALNAVIAAYPKPYAVLMDGLVMGGGVGVSAHGSHRFVTARTALAMPETSLGFFPDVGGTWLLSRAPGEFGTYIGLTGARLDAARAIYCRLADSRIGVEQWPGLVEELAAAKTRKDVIEPLTSCVIRLSDGRALAGNWAEIDAAFAGDNVEQIIARLKRSAAPFAAQALAALAARSPMALKVTLAALRRARTLKSLDDCLAMEMGLARAMSARPDFLEGIRAAVIDKDQKPRWAPARLEDIDSQTVARIIDGQAEQRA
jgi:enoyl-CoA hydratase